ncbi:MAG: tRNA 2-thiouridine(34) synthase MnmA, partial [Negativicutes bacterium]|nr:tRNA 2-thiouridine(34) synthase MnmA [Negativicutes bacterium]
VANQLAVDFYVLNMLTLFEQRVVRPFVDSYLGGETPNPCIECNRHLKLAALFRKAEELAIDRVATGHYARIIYDDECRRYRLLRAVDRQKDQSYVLYMLDQLAMAKLLLPLGGLTKEQTRAAAAGRRFAVADKPDSQDICFVPDGDYAGFIRRYSQSEPVAGDIVDEAGRIIGRHRGLIHYTVGQRRGLGIVGKTRAYVAGKDPSANRLVVSNDPRCRRFWVRGLSYTDESFRGQTGYIGIETRYRGPVVTGRIKQEDGSWAEVETEQPVVAAPGQAAVFYIGDEVMGGGVISGDRHKK